MASQHAPKSFNTPVEEPGTATAVGLLIASEASSGITRAVAVIVSTDVGWLVAGCVEGAVVGDIVVDVACPDVSAAVVVVACIIVVVVAVVVGIVVVVGGEDVYGSDIARLPRRPPVETLLPFRRLGLIAVSLRRLKSVDCVRRSGLARSSVGSTRPSASRLVLDAIASFRN